MTRHERGRVLQVPVSLAGLVVMWMVAVGLIVCDLLGGPGVGQLGLLASAGAAAWTVLYGFKGIREEHEMLRQAFELGQDSVRDSHLHGV